MSSDNEVNKRLSSMLQYVTSAASASIPEPSSSQQVPPSALEKLYAEAYKRGAAKSVAESLRYAERSFFSACDHANSFATLIRSHSASTSRVTIARGALEAASRSWWIAEDVTLDTHLHRVISMRWADLQFAKKFPDALEASSDGSNVDAEMLRQEYITELTALAFQSPRQ
ncbi:hypothetical protein [Leucobacter aridicollis]|uniref:hypothetical protein n=1 Tax=Leucobacter aridicollis TaxID=283878 RepID=UPI002168E605|nr:hypothetical protein [Leucobacter aridicollis]